MPHRFWSPQQLLISVSQHDVLCEHQIERPFAIVGSHVDCDVTLQNAGVPSRALLLIATQRGIRGVVLSEHAKRPGSIFSLPDRPMKLGTYSLTIGIADGATSQTNDSENDETIHTLTWSSAGVRRYVQIPNECPLLIGRKSPSHLILDDQRFSGVHCCIFRSNERLWVIDLCSTNGTSVDGNVASCAEVEIGKSISVGEERLHYVRMHTDTDVDGVRRELADAEQQRLAAVEDVQQLRTEIAKLRTDVSQSHEAANELRRELNDKLATQVAATAAERTSLQHERDTTVARLRREIDDKEAEVLEARATFRTDVERLQNELDLLASTQSELQTSLIQRDETIAELSETLDQRETTLVTIQETLTQLQTERDSISDRLEAEHAERFQEMATTLRERELELDRMQLELTTERRVLSALDDGIRIDVIEDVPALTSDEDCIASFDFHSLLEEALGALPPVGDDQST